MNKIDYQIIDRNDSKELAKFLSKEGQFLLPVLELIDQAEAAVDEVIDVMGRATIEAILTSAIFYLIDKSVNDIIKRSYQRFRIDGKSGLLLPLQENDLFITFIPNQTLFLSISELN